MCQRPRFDLVFVFGHSHCGSTLLGRMLNAHPLVFSPGELLWLDDALVKDLPCSCGEPLARCRFWQSVIPQIPDSIRANYRRTVPATFQLLRDVTQKPVILDLSKSRVHRTRFRWRRTNVGMIHVVRDPRGILASRLRYTTDLDHEIRGHIKWERRFESETARYGDRGLRVFYEDLVQDPTAVLQTLCRFLGIEFADSMLHFHNTEHHFMHSSTSKLLGQETRLRMDERWKDELTPAQLEEVTRRLTKIDLYRERYGLGTPHLPG